MIRGTQDPFLTYYHRELTYLRQAGGIFANKHPKIARRLGINLEESPDPHMERLLESFAFLTARLSQEIDDRLPQISAALLGVLYPQLINPIPAMAIAHFEADATKGSLTTGFPIPKETPLFTNAEEGVSCRFRTVYDITLWPISVTHVDFVQKDAYDIKGYGPKVPWYLRIRLKAQEGLLFSDLALKRLSFHLNGDRLLTFEMYGAIFGQHTPHVLVSTDQQTATPLPMPSITPVGFDDNHLILPHPGHAHPAYQLIQEYFHFPEKYLFFTVENISTAGVGNELDLLIAIEDTEVVGNIKLHPRNFLLGCTPMVNLFRRTTDPLRLDHRHTEYRLVPDQRRERTTEIYSINRIMATVEGQPDPIEFQPYFSFNHKTTQLRPDANNTSFWIARRAASLQQNMPGTEMFLTFVDLDFNPKLPAVQTIYGETLCTNRYLADQMTAGTLMQIEDRAPIAQIVCLDKPVSQVHSPTDGETLWRLISHLSVNHLSLTQGESSLEALKEMLRLYAGPESIYRHGEINAIQALSAKPIVRRVGDQAWRGFIPGVEVSLTMNEEELAGSSIFLMGSVLRYFFALQVSLNSFVEVVLYSPRRKGEWMRWQPLPGEQILL
ncbi:MAG: type VI secretion system baseplate subunit TssF [Alphaproteobacteria bacterium]|nr:type VI secretion system baseplate subunit TssF [Alphaproteobacteria bacterium]